MAHCSSILYTAGVFSDVHMLALMYAGELCYWSWSLAATSNKQTSDTLKLLDTKSHCNIASTVRSPNSLATLSEGESEKTTRESPAPSFVAVESPSSSGVGGDTEILSNIKALDPVPNKSNIMDPSEMMSHSCTGQEQAMQNVSLEDAKLLEAGSCSHCGGGDMWTVLTQLFCVMEHCKGTKAVENWKRRFDPLQRGQELLTKFVAVARGPLKTQGWNYSRAVQLLVTMKKADTAQV